MCLTLFFLSHFFLLKSNEAAHEGGGFCSEAQSTITAGASLTIQHNTCGEEGGGTTRAHPCVCLRDGFSPRDMTGPFTCTYRRNRRLVRHGQGDHHNWSQFVSVQQHRHAPRQVGRIFWPVTNSQIPDSYCLSLFNLPPSMNRRWRRVEWQLVPLGRRRLPDRTESRGDGRWWRLSLHGACDSGHASACDAARASYTVYVLSPLPSQENGTFSAGLRFTAEGNIAYNRGGAFASFDTYANFAGYVPLVRFDARLSRLTV